MGRREYIVGAADVLRENPNIHFTLLGAGQKRKEIEDLAQNLSLPNITFLGPVPYKVYLEYIKGADLSLGIFGGGDKASRVIANKIIESVALGTPLLTGRTAPVERYFKDGESIFFANMADAADLAKTILKAYNAKDLVVVSKRGQDVIRRHFSKDNLRNILKTL